MLDRDANSGKIGPMADQDNIVKFPGVPAPVPPNPERIPVGPAPVITPEMLEKSRLPDNRKPGHTTKGMHRLSKDDFKDTLALIERLKEKSGDFLSARRNDFDAKMAGCCPGREACRTPEGGLTGQIPVVKELRPWRCERVDGDPLGCNFGKAVYIEKCEEFLNEVQTYPVAGNLAKACIFRSNWISDTLSDKVKQYALDPKVLAKGKSLIVCGSTGPGKTHTGLAALAHMAVHGNGERKCADATVLKCDQLFDDYQTDRDLLKLAMTASFLLLDDLGAELDSKKNLKDFGMVLDARQAAALPTLITANLTAAELLTRYGKDRRIDSRLQLYEIFETQLPDKRASDDDE